MWNWEGKEGLSAPSDDSGLRCQGRQSASDFCKVRDYQDLVPVFGFFPLSGELFKYFFLVVMLCPCSELVAGILGGLKKIFCM